MAVPMIVKTIFNPTEFEAGADAPQCGQLLAVVDFSLPHSLQFLSAITMPFLLNSRDQQFVILLSKPAGVTQREISSGSQESQDDASQTETVLHEGVGVHAL